MLDMLKKVKKVGSQLMQINNKKFIRPIFAKIKNENENEYVSGVYYNEKLCLCEIIKSSSYQLQLSKKYLCFFSTNKKIKSQDEQVSSFKVKDKDSNKIKQRKLHTKPISQQQSKQKVKIYLQKQKNNKVEVDQKKYKFNFLNFISKYKQNDTTQGQNKKQKQKKRTNQQYQKNQSQQKVNIFDILIPIIGFPILIYFMWTKHVHKKEAYELIRTKIKISDQQNKVEIKNIDFQQIEKKLQTLFNDLKNENYSKNKQLCQWEKIKTIKVIINDQENKKLVGLKKFMLKKQNENYPVLFIDFKNEGKNYQWLECNVGLRQLYDPAVSSQLLSIFRTFSFIYQFNSQLVVIVINFSQEMKTKTQKQKQNNSNNINNTTQQKILHEEKIKFFQRLQQMQTFYQRQRLKANIILVFNNQKDYEQIMKQRKLQSSLYQVLK